MSRPRLLDLFCGAGGCSVGYRRAGFDVWGADIAPHPDYPYPFQRADAFDVLDDVEYLNTFDVVHASPPCPRYSVSAFATGNRDNHPDHLPPVRTMLQAWGGHYVIENVPGAPMPDAITLCGWAMGYRHLRRHRLFESDLWLMSPGCACPNGDTVSVYGHTGEDRRRTTIAVRGRVKVHAPLAEVRQLMGVPWMTRREDISDAIPPGYTQYIGEQLMEALTHERATAH